MIALESHPQGVVLPVRAQPGARRNGIRGEQAGRLRISVTQSPEKGKANRAIVGILRNALSLRAGQIELIAGETSPQKRFLLRGIDHDELARRLQQILGDLAGK